MENAAEALQMAAAVLVFILALSITIANFGVARQTSQTVLEYNDKGEYDPGYFLEFSLDPNNVDESTTRIVTAETIIPTIYKAYKENYKIVFDNIPYYLYKLNVRDPNTNNYVVHEMNNIDLANGIVLANDTQKEEFIKVLLYGTNSRNDRTGDPIDLNQFNNAGISFDGSIVSNTGGLYNYISGKSFREKLGVYYQEEINGKEVSTPDANKTIKREITYSVT